MKEIILIFLATIFVIGFWPFMAYIYVYSYDTYYNQFVEDCAKHRSLEDCMKDGKKLYGSQSNSSKFTRD